MDETDAFVWSRVPQQPRAVDTPCIQYVQLQSLPRHAMPSTVRRLAQTTRRMGNIDASQTPETCPISTVPVPRRYTPPLPKIDPPAPDFQEPSSFMQRTRHKFHPHAAFRHPSPASDAAGALRPPVACLVRIKSDLIAAGADLALTVRSMRPVADTRPRRSQQSVGHHLRLPLQVQMWRWWRPSTAMMGPPLQCGSRQRRRRWRRDPSQSVVGREARRYLLSRPEHRRRVGEDVQLVVWRVLHMLGIHHAIPVQRRYPLHPVLVRAGRELRLIVRCARRLRTRQGGVSRHSLLRRRPRIMELGEVV